jgi:hypothetical protein
VRTRGFGGFSCAAVFSLLAAQAGAADYTYLLNVNTLAVGASVGESLTVKESCVDPNATNQTTCEKTKYVTALPGRTGRIEFPISVAGSFDVSVNMDTNSSSGGGVWGEALTLFSNDGSTISMTYRIHIGGNGVVICASDNAQDTGTGSPNSAWVSEWGWIGGFTSNDSRIAIQNSMATCFINGTSFVSGQQPNAVSLADPNRAYNRVAVTGINDRDRLYEIKVRGLQSTSCPTTGNTGTATLDSNLKLHIPALKYQPALGNAMNLWADLQFAPAADGSLAWKLSNYGVNP